MSNKLSKFLLAKQEIKAFFEFHIDQEKKIKK
jgi:hypothetical protein